MRYFKLATHLTMPRSLLPGIGDTHERPHPGDVVAIDDGACARDSRFINGRVNAGDIKETTESEYLAFAKARLDADNLAATSAEPQAAKLAAKGK